MKKISILFLALVASTASLFAAVERVQIDALYYLLDHSLKTATVTYSTANVTGIQQHNYASFTDNTTLSVSEEVYYDDKPYTVTAIGDSAFLNVKMFACYLPSSVTSIGRFAFYGSTVAFVDPYGDEGISGLTSIGEKAFQGCERLDMFFLPSSLKTIGDLAFNACRALQNVEIPDNVSSIGWGAYGYCSAIKSLTLGKSLISVGKEAFKGLTALENIYCRNTAPATLGADCFLNVDKSNVVVYVPAGTVAAYRAAAGWSDFTRIYEAVAKVGDLYYYLYADGTAEVIDDQDPNHSYLNPYPDITELVIPATVSYDDNTYMVTKIGNGAFESCQNLTTVTLPATLEKIAESAFYYSSITSVEIPNTVRTIGMSAFSMCTNLASANLPTGLTTINYGLFSGCSKLTSINIPEHVKTIGGAAFNFCGLTSIDLPASLVQIGSGAFGFCDKLTSVTCRALVPPAAEGAFAGVETANIPLYVHAFYVNDYKAAAEWEKFTNVLPIPETQDIETTPSPLRGESERGYKLLRDGVLLIERNGKTYNAQGAQVQ
ncbi:MAG: leucine-rich repeat domain-containing protein [Paludibacteraceae bacterium]|nr:leucine-rich repeat domain-containing protein [Paludibacteraceae bacterium]MBQ8704723.1 leucine-rich repeat domain-containing protein [Paludibacteraceae bacterium]